MKLFQKEASYPTLTKPGRFQTQRLPSSERQFYGLSHQASTRDFRIRTRAFPTCIRVRLTGNFCKLLSPGRAQGLLLVEEDLLPWHQEQVGSHIILVQDCFFVFALVQSWTDVGDIAPAQDGKNDDEENPVQVHAEDCTKVRPAKQSLLIHCLQPTATPCIP